MEHERILPVSESRRATLEMVLEASTRNGWQAATLLGERGIAEQAVEHFRLGWLADKIDGFEAYQGMLVIPYLLDDNRPVQLRFRCACQHDGSCKDLGHPKYKGMSGDPTRPFNVRAITSATNELHITEGELDAIVLWQCGFNAIALPGATQWKPHYYQLLAGFSRVVCWGDPDEAGRTFNGTLVEKLRQAVIAHPHDGDVNETYLTKGADEILRLASEAR